MQSIRKLSTKRNSQSIHSREANRCILPRFPCCKSQMKWIGTYIIRNTRKHCYWSFCFGTWIVPNIEEKRRAAPGPCFFPFSGWPVACGVYSRFMGIWHIICRIIVYLMTWKQFIYFTIWNASLEVSFRLNRDLGRILNLAYETCTWF